MCWGGVQVKSSMEIPTPHPPKPLLGHQPTEEKWAGGTWTSPGRLSHKPAERGGQPLHQCVPPQVEAGLTCVFMASQTLTGGGGYCINTDILLTSHVILSKLQSCRRPRRHRRSIWDEGPLLFREHSGLIPFFMGEAVRFATAFGEDAAANKPLQTQRRSLPRPFVKWNADAAFYGDIRRVRGRSTERLFSKVWVFPQTFVL